MAKKTNKNKKLNSKNNKSLVVLTALGLLLISLLYINFTSFSFQKFTSDFSSKFNDGTTKYIEAPLRKNKAGFKYYTKIVDSIGEPKSLTIARVENDSQRWNGYSVTKRYYGSGSHEQIRNELIKKGESLGFEFKDSDVSMWGNRGYYPEGTLVESRLLAVCNEATVEILIKEQNSNKDSPLLVRVYAFGSGGGEGENCPDL